MHVPEGRSPRMPASGRSGFALQGQRACRARDAAAGGVAEPAVRHGASTLQRSTGFRRGRDGGAATDPGRALPSGRPRPAIP